VPAAFIPLSPKQANRSSNMNSRFMPAATTGWAGVVADELQQARAGLRALLSAANELLGSLRLLILPCLPEGNGPDTQVKPGAIPVPRRWPPAGR
jgi:hypothetical protein